MNIIDPGHKYVVDVYDANKSELPVSIRFMKRVGSVYPGNTGEPYSGTNCQELMRVIIDRTKYLNGQYAHKNNEAIIRKAQEILWLFEDRAAERHGFAPHDIDFRPDDIETESHCLICGHIMCRGHE